MKFELGSTIYFCKSVKAMITFYTTVMGLKLTGERDIPLEEWAELKGKGGFRLCLHKAGKPGSPLNNRNKLVFRVTDVAQARKYLLDRVSRWKSILIGPTLKPAMEKIRKGTDFRSRVRRARAA